jgi:transglutaminase-like putative cysteine protease
MGAMNDFFGASNYTQRSKAMETAAYTMLTFLQWLPMVFYPFVAAQAYSRHAQLDPALFTALGRRKRELKEIQPGPGKRGVNGGYIYFGICLLATSAANEERYWFYLALCPIMAYALWPQRSRRYRPATWGVFIVAAAVLGLALALGLRQMHVLLNDLQTAWLSGRIGRGGDAREARTSIGQVGKLKGTSRILLRLEIPPHASATPLLRETTYNWYRGASWISTGGKKEFGSVYYETNETSWVFSSANPSNEIIITSYLAGGKGLLAVPHGLTRLDELPVFDLRTNHVGTLRVDSGPGLVSYRARGGSATALDALPDPAMDFDVPTNERPAIAQIVAELKLAEMTEPQRVRALESFFAKHFEYSLYQEKSPAEYTNAAIRTPLAWFLLKDRKGHCEYFGTAATLILRQAGIPARYTVGWSVQESAGGNRFVVRGRHAHAWCVYYDREAKLWRELDTTPGTWLGMEENERPFYQPIQDACSWLYLQYSKLRWGQGQLRTYVFLVLVAAVVLLVIRFAWSARKRRKQRPGEAGETGMVLRGLDSEFFRVEQWLERQGLPRRPGEPLWIWLRRVEEHLPGGVNPLRQLVMLHYRLRFDPVGITEAERDALRQQVEAWLRQPASGAKK